MHRLQFLGALVLVLVYTGVHSRLISSISTMTVNERNDKHLRTLSIQSADTNMVSSFGSVTSIPMLSPTIAGGISVPTTRELDHIPLANINVPSIRNPNQGNGNGKAIDEEVGSLLSRRGLELAVPLVAFFFTLAIGFYRPPREPDTFWTIANLLAAVSILPFHDQPFSDIVGNVVKGVAVASNVLHYRATLGKNFRPAIALVLTIVVYFLLYSQRRNVIPEGPEDKGLRVVAPWICAPVAIVIVSELFKLLQLLMLNCSAILEWSRHAIAGR